MKRAGQYGLNEPLTEPLLKLDLRWRGKSLANLMNIMPLNVVGRVSSRDRPDRDGRLVVLAMAIYNVVMGMPRS